MWRTTSIVVLAALAGACGDAELTETTAAGRLVPVQGYEVWENPPVENGDPNHVPPQAEFLRTSDKTPITSYPDLGSVGFDPDLDPRTERNNLEVQSSPSDPASVFYLLHISDFQIPDAQTPAFTPTNKYALKLDGERLGLGSFRPQSPYLPRSADGMIRTANRLVDETRPYDLAVHTGDSCENAQDNEQDWFFAVMNGGRIDPNTGDAPPMVPPGDDDPLAAFDTEGLRSGIPWLVSIGNHDLLAQGNYPQGFIDYLNTPGISEELQRFFGEKGIALPPHSTADHRRNRLTADQILGVSAPGVVPALNAQLDLDVVVSALDFRDSFEAYYDAGTLDPIAATPNPARLAHDRCGFIDRFFDPKNDGSGPAGHGFREDANGPAPENAGCPGWYAYTPPGNPVLRIVNLDLNFEYGFSQGMISRPQQAYDSSTLAEVDEPLSREFSTSDEGILLRPGTAIPLFQVPALQGAAVDALRNDPAYDQIAFIESADRTRRAGESAGDLPEPPAVRELGGEELPPARTRPRDLRALRRLRPVRADRRPASAGQPSCLEVVRKAVGRDGLPEPDRRPTSTGTRT